MLENKWANKCAHKINVEKMLWKAYGRLVCYILHFERESVDNIF